MHEHFDCRRAFHHIEFLSQMRRLPGTEGEAEARRYIRAVGEEMGIKMWEEEFSYSVTPLTVVMPLICLFSAAISLVGSFSYLWGTSLAVVPGAVLLAVIFAGFRWSGTFEKLAARGGPRKSANLIGEIRGASPRGTIMLSAHYDAKSQLMPVVIRATLYILGYFSALLLGGALVVVGAIRAAGVDVPGTTGAFYASLVPAVFLFSLVLNFTGNRSPGALDDASGEAVILEVARVLKDKPLGNFDVRIASFGCEEVGLCGSINHLLRHQDELKERKFYMLNFDIPFSPKGSLGLNTGFEIPPRSTSGHLNSLAEGAASDMGFEMKGIFLPVGAAADHMPWSKHGFEVTAFVSASACVHSAADSIDKVNREALRRSGEVALAVIRGLDQELSESSSHGVSSGADDLEAT